MWLAAEEVLHGLDDLRHARHAADEDDFINFTGREACILQGRLTGPQGALDQVAHQRFELGPGQLDVQMLRPALVGSDEGQVHLGRLRGRQFDLRLLGSFLEPLKRQLVLAQVDALLLFELLGEIFDDLVVEVLTTEEGVAIGGFHLEHAIPNLEDRNVEGAATQIVNCDRSALLLFEAIGKRSRGRLVDDAQDLEPRDLAGVLCGLTLRVVEVGRNGNDRLLDLLAEEALGGFLHLLEDVGRNLAGAVGLALYLDPGVAVGALDDLVGDKLLVLRDRRVTVAPPDQALDGEERVLRVGDALALGRLPNDDAVVRKANHGRRGARTLSVLDDPGVLAVHHRYAGVGRAKVDTDDFAHVIPLCSAELRGRPRRSTVLQSPFVTLHLKSSARHAAHEGFSIWRRNELSKPLPARKGI